MLFNSFGFLLFFPIVCLIYFLIPWNKIRVLFLLLASFYFYMNWKPVYSILLMASIIITYTTAIGMEKGRYKKTLLCISIFSNIGILIFFKYWNFLAESITDAFIFLGISFHVPGLHFLLPVGISFYTFQALGYTIDVYKGTAKAEKDFSIYALFISFFPQLVAGPIERAGNLIQQFKITHKLNLNSTSEGLKMMLWGFFMKIVVADRLAIYVDAVYNNIGQHTGASILLATFFFAIQIYCDFGGYSLIAIGASRIMGIKLMDNFNRPYFSTSITTFWRRWHISLSKWLKDYIYIPLGGNRVSKIRNIFNIFITFLVSGIWHGANWTFIIWGILHGFFQIIEKIFKIGNKEYRGIQKIFHIIITFILVCFAWIFFRANNLNDALKAVISIVQNANEHLFIPEHSIILPYSLMAIFILLFKDIRDEFFPNHFKLFENKNIVIRFASYILILFIILLFGVFDNSQFIYFQF